jgi:hypothetical protein
MHVEYGVVKVLFNLTTNFCGTDSHSQVSFLADLLTICIPYLVSPHLMYHMFNLYKVLVFPSPALVSKTALGFWRVTLSGPVGE